MKHLDRSYLFSDVLKPFLTFHLFTSEMKVTSLSRNGTGGTLATVLPSRSHCIEVF